MPEKSASLIVCHAANPFSKLLAANIRGSSRVEIMSAFATRGGLRALERVMPEGTLEQTSGRFYCVLNRRQTSKDFALAALRDFGRWRLFGLKPLGSAIPGIIHGKAVLLRGARDSRLYVTSANLTGGGLERNQEICASIKVGRQSTLEGLLHMDSWATVEELTLANRRHWQRSVGDEYAVREAAQEIVEDPEPASTAGGRTLILEKREYETGGGGQIQIPKAAFEDFFGGTGGPLDIWIAGEQRTCMLSVFDNVTFRIAVRELSHLGQAWVIFKEMQDAATASRIYKVRIVDESGFSRMKEKYEGQWAEGGAGRRYLTL